MWTTFNFICPHHARTLHNLFGILLPEAFILILYQFKMDLEGFLKIITPLTTYLLFLSPIPNLRKWIKVDSIDSFNPLPLIMGFILSLFLFLYGYLANVSTLLTSSSVGCLLNTSYLIIYFIYTKQKFQYCKQVFTYLAVVAGIVWYATTLDHAAAVKFAGVVSAITKIFRMASPLAGLKTVMNTKCTVTLPFPLILLGFIVSLEWTILATILKDNFILIPNAIGSVLAAMQLSLFLIYPSTMPGKKDK